MKVKGAERNYLQIIILLGLTVVILPFPSLIAQSVKEKLEIALASLPHPESVSDFEHIPHLYPINQDSTLVCWSFATSSFIESEMKRFGRKPVRLSVIFPVYYGFIEKAKRFVQTRGESRLDPGDLFSGVLDIAKQYGMVPEAVYEGEKKEKTIYNHNALYSELTTLMQEAKNDAIWDESEVIKKIRLVLDEHFGAPPKKFIYDNKEYTPQSFFADIVHLPLEEYLTVTSFQYASFNRFIELRVLDNWKHHADYFNVPLDVFYRSFKHALVHGYTVAIDMDNSEPSYKMTKQYAFIPEYEVPKDSLSQEKREALFLSGATTDDHLMHAVAYKLFGTEEWFLTKDSWRTAWEGPNHGYFFLHESYIKLKVLAFLVHRDGVPEMKKLIAPPD